MLIAYDRDEPGDRAAEKLAAGLPVRPRAEFTGCPHEDLAEPERVHVDAVIIFIPEHIILLTKINPKINMLNAITRITIVDIDISNAAFLLLFFKLFIFLFLR